LSKTCLKFRRYPLDLRSCASRFFSEQSNPDPKVPENAEPNRRTIYDLNVAQDYIKSNIRKFDWTTYCTSNYVPSQVRTDFMNIYWFYHELSRAVENSRETALGLGKIEFWADSVEKIFDDIPIKEPVAIALHNTCKNNPLPKSLFLQLINAKRYEVNTPECADLLQFETIAELNRTTLLMIILRLLQVDTKNEAVQIVAEHAGKSLGMIDFIKKVPFSLRKYKLFLPDDILRKHNVSVRNLWNRVEGKPKEELFDVILEVASHAKKHLEVAKEAGKDLPPNAFRAFLHCVEAEYFLDRLEANNFNIFTQSLHVPGYSTVPYRVFKSARKQIFY